MKFICLHAPGRNCPDLRPCVDLLPSSLEDFRCAGSREDSEFECPGCNRIDASELTHKGGKLHEWHRAMVPSFDGPIRRGHAISHPLNISLDALLHPLRRLGRAGPDWCQCCGDQCTINCRNRTIGYA